MCWSGFVFLCPWQLLTLFSFLFTDAFCRSILRMNVCKSFWNCQAPHTVSNMYFYFFTQLQSCWMNLADCHKRTHFYLQFLIFVNIEKNYIKDKNLSCWLVGIKLYNFKNSNSWILLLFYVHNAHNNVFHILFKIAFLWIVHWEEWREKLVLF